MKKNSKEQIKKNSEQKKQLKEKGINWMSNGKDIITRLIVGLINKTLYKNESVRRNSIRRINGRNQRNKH